MLVLFDEVLNRDTADGGWVLDPHEGLLPTLSTISAEVASTAPPAGANSIAAHVEHLRFYFERVNAYSRGENPDTPWSVSWQIQQVDEAKWTEIRTAMEKEWREFVSFIERTNDWPDPDMQTGAIAACVHAAYHLGSIRQLMFSARSQTSA